MSLRIIICTLNTAVWTQNLWYFCVPLSENEAGSELLYLYGTDVNFATYGKSKSASCD